MIIIRKKRLITEMSNLIRPVKEVEDWSVEEKNSYWNSLRTECDRRKEKATGCSWLIAVLSPLFRNFPIEIRGAENILCDMDRSDYSERINRISIN